MELSIAINVCIALVTVASLAAVVGLLVQAANLAHKWVEHGHNHKLRDYVSRRPASLAAKVRRQTNRRRAA